MKVRTINEEPLVTLFKSLKVGDTFLFDIKYDGSVSAFMKLKKEGKGELVRSAVELETGRLWSFSDEDEVDPIEGEFVYED